MSTSPNLRVNNITEQIYVFQKITTQPYRIQILRSLYDSIKIIECESFVCANCYHSAVFQCHASHTMLVIIFSNKSIFSVFTSEWLFVVLFKTCFF